MDTLKKLVEEGFDSDAVEASMNTIEFSLRENNTRSFPRRLSLMLQSIVSLYACVYLFRCHFLSVD